MCCFSAPVEHVGDTKIFARLSGRGTQYLIYQMTYAATRPVAMILPLPVTLPARAGSLRFINLKGYPDFFIDMHHGFAEHRAFSVVGLKSIEAGGTEPVLPTYTVGDFVASFVPTMDDFRRLDPRFLLPRATLDKIPVYRDYGFAVFQLKAPRGAITTPHPMAFEFETRSRNAVYFPTVHIHDGQVHPTEHFDHALYLQDTGPHGDTSSRPAKDFLKVERTQGIIRGDALCRRVEMRGYFSNEDVFLNTLGDPTKLIVPGGVAAVAGLALARYLKRQRSRHPTTT